MYIVEMCIFCGAGDDSFIHPDYEATSRGPQRGCNLVHLACNLDFVNTNP